MSCVLINLQSLPPQKRALGMFLFGFAATSHPANHQSLTQARVTVLCTWALMLLATAGSAACNSTCRDSARGLSRPRHGTGVCASPQPAKTKQLLSREETAIQVAFSAYVEHLQPWGKQWQHTLGKTCCSLHSGFLWCTQNLNDTSTHCFLYSAKEN